MCRDGTGCRCGLSCSVWARRRAGSSLGTPLGHVRDCRFASSRVVSPLRFARYRIAALRRAVGPGLVLPCRSAVQRFAARFETAPFRAVMFCRSDSGIAGSRLSAVMPLVFALC